MRKSISVSELQRKIRELTPILVDRYQVESIALFGSYVRGEERPDSDLDVLVTFRETPSLFKLLRLEHFLSDALGVPVDLVMKDTLKPRIGERILKEAV
ncbi:MAG TPA: nucleotidyltransferase family protein, partial [Caldilineae bacterium]|nr:nucleotidyltransferase family protein [Caldilineae bacterium]